MYLFSRIPLTLIVSTMRPVHRLIPLPSSSDVIYLRSPRIINYIVYNKIGKNSAVPTKLLKILFTEEELVLVRANFSVPLPCLPVRYTFKIITSWKLLRIHEVLWCHVTYLLFTEKSWPFYGYMAMKKLDNYLG